MTRHFRKVALAGVVVCAVAAALAGTVKAQSAGPWISTYEGPGGSRCYVGVWSRQGAYNTRMSMQAQFCYSGGYPSAFGPGPGAGGYRPGVAGPYPPPSYQGYGPRPYPYYPWPVPWGF